MVTPRKLNERGRSQHSIMLPSLEKLGFKPIRFDQIAAAVREEAGL